MKNPLSRIKLKTNLELILKKIAIDYSLGKITNCQVFGKGVIEVNIKLTTTKGEYVVKIFPTKKLWQVKQLTGFLRYIYKTKVPTNLIYNNKNDKLFFRLRSAQDGYYYGCVLSYFNGQDFTRHNPADQVLYQIGEYLARINKASFKVRYHYDDCLIPNLSREAKKKLYLVRSRKYIEILLKYVKLLQQIDFAKLQRDIIHGDLSREHVLEGTKGICILDFGALSTGYSIVDLAVAISWYCLDVGHFSQKEFLRKYHLMLSSYQKYNKLSKYELKVLPILVKANYAMNYLLGTYYLKHFKELHAKYYLDFGRRGIDKIERIEVWKPASYL